MPNKRAVSVWEGGLTGGRGKVTRGSEAESDALSWPGRLGEDAGTTSPEELIAAAHAGCFSMALAHEMEVEGLHPTQLEVAAECVLRNAEGQGLKIEGIELAVRACADGADDAALQRAVSRAEVSCPVSNALRGNVAIRVDARLVD